jgi:hypothetical protein
MKRRNPALKIPRTSNPYRFKSGPGHQRTSNQQVAMTAGFLLIINELIMLIPAYLKKNFFLRTKKGLNESIPSSFLSPTRLFLRNNKNNQSLLDTLLDY